MGTLRQNQSWWKNHLWGACVFIHWVETEHNSRKLHLLEDPLSEVALGPKHLSYFPSFIQNRTRADVTQSPERLQDHPGVTSLSLNREEHTDTVGVRITVQSWVDPPHVRFFPLLEFACDLFRIKCAQFCSLTLEYALITFSLACSCGSYFSSSWSNRAEKLKC